MTWSDPRALPSVKLHQKQCGLIIDKDFLFSDVLSRVDDVHVIQAHMLRMLRWNFFGGSLEKTLPPLSWEIEWKSAIIAVK